jgi:small conductance mechanosensitive channel
MDWLKDIFGISYTEFNQLLLRFGTRLLIAALIIFIGFWIAGLLTKALRKMLNKSDIDTGLVTFLTSFFSMAFKILVLVTAIMELGIQMTSIIALLGAAGLAIGMAFSGTLSNFAGGIMILVLKPFKVGDFVDAQGVQGVVTEIQIFNTYLSTVDNKIIILPNGPTANGNIINFTKADKRRVEWIISISYGDDVEKAKTKLQQLFNEEERILKDPEPLIALHALANSSINIVARVWVKTPDFHPVFFAINERVYKEFPQEGLSFPFPQMDVHLKSKN